MPFFYNISGAVTGGQLECSCQLTWPGKGKTNLEIFLKEQNKYLGPYLFQPKHWRIFHFRKFFYFLDTVRSQPNPALRRGSLIHPYLHVVWSRTNNEKWKKEAKAKKYEKFKIQQGNVKKAKKLVWYLSVRNGRWTTKFESEKCKKWKQICKKFEIN